MAKPNIQHGWLGAQPKFSEMKLKTDSHKDGEFKVSGDNSVKIKFDTGAPVKVVTKFTQCSKDEDLPEYVFTQRKNKNGVQFYVGFPENGFYKFQIFAIEESSPSESLPNVYNYLIEVQNNHKPASPYVKAYTKFFTDCCELDEPMVLNEHSSNLDNVKFEMVVPGAEKVAVHCKEEWFHLTKKGGSWEGRADLARYKGKSEKVTVNANYDKDSNSFSVLLEYRI